MGAVCGREGPGAHAQVSWGSCQKAEESGDQDDEVLSFGNINEKHEKRARNLCIPPRKSSVL